MTLAERSEWLQPDQIIGDYHIISLLSSDNVTARVQARHRVMNRVVAISVYAPGFDDESEGEHIRQRACDAGELSHSCITGLLDLGEHAGCVFVVEEFVGGRDLLQQIRAETISLRTIVEYALQAAEGIAYLHEQGYFHGSLTVDDLRLDTKGRVKLLNCTRLRKTTRHSELSNDAENLTRLLQRLLTEYRESQVEKLTTNAKLQLSKVEAVSQKYPHLNEFIAELTTVAEELGESPLPAGSRSHSLRTWLMVSIPVAAIFILIVALFYPGDPPRPSPLSPSLVASAPRAVAPFDSDAALRYQQDTAQHLQIPLEHTNSIGMTFRLVPAGEYTFGTSAEEVARVSVQAADDTNFLPRLRAETQRSVRIERPFYFAICEVTQSQYETVASVNPSSFQEGEVHKDLAIPTSEFPVERTSYIDAEKFCKALSNRPGEEWREYRLPSEEEWEFACRAGTVTAFWSGDDLHQDEAQFGKWNMERHPLKVGSFKPNPFGLYDMHGNVWEWTSSECPPTEEAPNEAGRRVFRGGSIPDPPWACRSAHRNSDTDTVQHFQVGFRVVLEVSGPTPD